jgi:hypothetical protein
VTSFKAGDVLTVRLKYSTSAGVNGAADFWVAIDAMGTPADPGTRLYTSDARVTVRENFSTYFSFSPPFRVPDVRKNIIIVPMTTFIAGGQEFGPTIDAVWKRYTDGAFHPFMRPPLPGITNGKVP